MASLFGFTLTKKAEEESNLSFAPPQNDDGATIVASGMFAGSYLDYDITSKSDGDLINRYRDISMYPTCNSGIEEIVNECISVEDDDTVVTIGLDDTGLPKNVKLAIADEFNTVLDLLEFKTKAHDIFKRWYIDGRIYYHKILSENVAEGIDELRYVDPRKLKRVKQVQKEADPATGLQMTEITDDFYIYSDVSVASARGPSTTSGTSQGVKISIDSIASVTSGLNDWEKGGIQSHLHRALKPVNQLRMVEDAVVINALVRAPMRRLFNVYTGNLNASRSEQHLRDVMNRFRNKLVYDTATGEMKDEKKHMSMVEDYWFARGKDGEQTTIQNIEGGAEIVDNDMLQYYQKKLYEALNVPFSRMQSDGMISFGRQAEISKEELKFAKYINRLRRKFTELFDDILCTQLIAKGVLTYDDWKAIQKKIKYVFNSDIYWQQTKQNDILRDQIDIVTMMDPFVGKYFSREWIVKNVLKISDEDQEEMQAQMEFDREQDLAAQQQEMLMQAQVQAEAQGESK
jgi:hypothetical protein